jgi:hypothetical protein
MKFSAKLSEAIAFTIISVLLFSGVSILVSHLGGGDENFSAFLQTSAP